MKIEHHSLQILLLGGISNKRFGLIIITKNKKFSFKLSNLFSLSLKTQLNKMNANLHSQFLTPFSSAIKESAVQIPKKTYNKNKGNLSKKDYSKCK